MNKGPQRGASRFGDGRSYAEKASEAYEGMPPEWIVALAELADNAGLDAAAQAIGYSPSAVSTALRKVYGGDVGRIEEKVRGALLGMMVICPEIGEMSRDTCLDWQAKPKAATSAHRLRMYRACRSGCPHYLAKGGSNGPE